MLRNVCFFSISPSLSLLVCSQQQQQQNILIQIGSYIESIPRWTVELNQNEESQISLTKLVGSGNRQLNQSNDQQPIQASQQFVNPTTNDELWWPVDIKRIQVRPTLDVFIKSGALPSYILAGIEVRVPSSCSMDGKEWKNFGMNSQPLASQWTSFGIAIEQGFRIETFVGIEQSSDDEEDHENEKEGDEKEKSTNDGKKANVQWQPLNSLFEDEQSCSDQKAMASKGTRNAIQMLGDFLANIDESSPLADGMHIVSIPIDDTWRDLPKGTERNEKLRLVSVGTSEPDAMKVLGLDEDLIALSATSVLDVGIILVAPGSNSEYIPNVYKPLYIANSQ